jgi:DNA repair exonuclease SbcCD ATPase subunit
MGSRQSGRPNAEVHAENIGGIDETRVTFSPGVTILVGENATNRTSFLRALMAGIGSRDITIKGDADEARVELTLSEETYRRRLRHWADGIAVEGDAYVDDPTLANLFAFLLESNEVRRAVATGGDLRDLLMRPIDTDEIHAEIDRLVDERERIEQELDEIDGLKADLPDLEQRRTELREAIEQKQAELEATEEELEAADADLEETRKEKAELEEKFEELQSKRTRLAEIRYDLETERESLDALRTERRDLKDDRKALPEAPEEDIEELDARLEELRERKGTLEREVNELQNVIEFNEGMLADTDKGPFKALTRGGDPMNGLITEQTVTCWTCGSEVNRDRVETTVDRLQELSRTKMSQIDKLEGQIEDVRATKRDKQESRQKRERITERLAEIGDEISDAEETIERLQERRDEVRAAIETAEAEIEERNRDDDNEVLDLHREANELEYELGKLETERDRIESEITDIEERLEERDTLATRLENVTEEIRDLRTRIDRIERNAVDEFNDHMETILDELGYDNLDRIWLERVEKEASGGPRTVKKKAFELHVVRTTESGTAYEDTVDHLSESEREVTGLVFALAGYLVHEVYESVPFMLLDSLEAIDSNRIATLIEYLEEYADYLVVALLPEDAEALPGSYERVTDI